MTIFPSMFKKTCFINVIIIIMLFNISNEFENMAFRPRNIGAPCEWEGVSGNCIDYWACVTNAIDALHGIHPPVCSIEGNEVLACCTSCYTVANISTTVLIEGHIFEKNNRKSHDKCLDFLKLYGGLYKCYWNAFGVGDVVKVYEDDCFGYGQKGSRGSGGEDARRAQYPHMALLGYGHDRGSAQWLCGGSIISEWFILTAGHCRSNQIGDVEFVGLGILKRSDPPSVWQVYRVDSFIAHPEYRPPSKYHDIALIRTDRRIEFSHTVLPACLASIRETAMDLDVETAYATGWGKLGYRQRLADVLQKVRLTKFSLEGCAEQYHPHRHLRHGFHNSTQMCYGDSDVGRDTCEGDSGGPLQIDEWWTCPQIIIGVTSAGHPCGFAGTAGLYTRVVHYQPWIEGIVWP